MQAAGRGRMLPRPASRGDLSRCDSPPSAFAAMHDLNAETTAHLMGPATPAPAGRLLPMADGRVELGFPLPHLDWETADVDLGEVLVPNPLSTFLYRASGHSMVLAGIVDGDILAVDRSIRPRSGDLVIASWDGCAPTCKVLRLDGDRIILESRNPHHKPIEIPKGSEVELFCITAVARQVRRG